MARSKPQDKNITCIVCERPGHTKWECSFWKTIQAVQTKSAPGTATSAEFDESDNEADGVVFRAVNGLVIDVSITFAHFPTSVAFVQALYGLRGCIP
jgi:hypothetical protein